MATNKQKYAETYAKCFAEVYPELPVERVRNLIAKATETAIENIYNVNIDSPAFKLCSKKLGIKHNKKSIQQYINS